MIPQVVIRWRNEMFGKKPGYRLISGSALVAIAAIVILLANLCYLALSRAAALTPMLIVVDGLAAAAIILYRQLRQTTQSLIASEARAHHMALHDGLTNLPNRILFLDRLAQELEQLRHGDGVVAVVIVGLDQFNQTRDAFGYQCGDQLIQDAGRRLAALPDKGVLLARISAESFAFIERDAERADALVAQVRSVIAEPYALSVGTAFVSCSIGVGLAVDEPLDPDDLVCRADIALRHAREGGRNAVRFYDPSMDQALKVRKVIENELREALEGGELSMVYQPQTSAQGAIIGVEALVRWRHRERGEISPGYFVSVAEESDLIHSLGRFTLRQAFIDAQRWPGLKVAINVSASQLARQDFLDELNGVIADTGIDPGRIEIEITESVLIGDDVQTRRNLRGLRSLGFTLALDDFGKGYSSLGYLLRHRVDKIKIDRSFIAPLGGDTGADAVVGAMIKLGDALNLRVLAEGVETEAQLARLTELGCKEIQGYIFSIPAEAEVIDVLVGAKRSIAA